MKRPYFTIKESRQKLVEACSELYVHELLTGDSRTISTRKALETIILDIGDVMVAMMGKETDKVDLDVDENKAMPVADEENW